MELRQKLRPNPRTSKRALVLVTAAVATLGAASLLVTGAGSDMSRNHHRIPCPEPAALEIWTGGVRDLAPDSAQLPF